MKHNDTAMKLIVERLYEKAMRSSTPKKTAGDMYEAAEIIQQLMEERDEARKQATPQYLITMDYGEYSDFNSLPVMIVLDSITADLIIQDLRENSNSPYRNVVQESCRMEIPEDAGFSWKKLPYVILQASEDF